MTLTEILANEELRQREFPVARGKIFLAHGGVCPLPSRVADAMAACAQQGTLGDQEAFVMHRLDDARKLGAQLLNCQPDEIALVGPTSLGLSFVAAGLKFRRTDLPKPHATYSPIIFTNTLFCLRPSNSP